MKKFNSLFIAGKTWVMISGEYTFAKVKEVHETRNWITVEGYGGSFQRNHIVQFSNKDQPPHVEEPSQFFADQYGSVYERRAFDNLFIGKLNGRSLKEFLVDKEERELY